jgi:hypothetical protein
MAGKLGAETATLENIELCSLSTFEFGAPDGRGYEVVPIAVANF